MNSSRSTVVPVALLVGLVTYCDWHLLNKPNQRLKFESYQLELRRVLGRAVAEKKFYVQMMSKDVEALCFLVSRDVESYYKSGGADETTKNRLKMFLSQTFQVPEGTARISAVYYGTLVSDRLALMKRTSQLNLLKKAGRILLVVIVALVVIAAAIAVIGLVYMAVMAIVEFVMVVVRFVIDKFYWIMGITALIGMIIGANNDERTKAGETPKPKFPQRNTSPTRDVDSSVGGSAAFYSYEHKEPSTGHSPNSQDMSENSGRESSPHFSPKMGAVTSLGRDLYLSERHGVVSHLDGGTYITSKGVLIFDSDSGSVDTDGNVTVEMFGMNCDVASGETQSSDTSGISAAASFFLDGPESKISSDSDGDNSSFWSRY